MIFIKPGLKRLKRDARDWSHRRTFGAAPLPDLPDEHLLVSSILDQDGRPHCTSYSACAIRESQAGISFDPEFFYDKEGEVNGRVSSDGYDLRVAMKTGCRGGFRPVGGGNPADFNEDSFFDLLDRPQGYDLFDSIRSAMWLAKGEKRCAELGSLFFREWIYSPQGLIQKSYASMSTIGLHAFKCAGWARKTRDGAALPGNDPYLVVQNSFGNSYGDGGLFYFPREVVNKYFVEGAYCWRLKPDPEMVRKIGFIVSLLRQVVALLTRLAVRSGIHLT